MSGYRSDLNAARARIEALEQKLAQARDEARVDRRELEEALEKARDEAKLLQTQLSWHTLPRMTGPLLSSAVFFMIAVSLSLVAVHRSATRPMVPVHSSIGTAREARPPAHDESSAAHVDTLTQLQTGAREAALRCADPLARPMRARLRVRFANAGTPQAVSVETDRELPRETVACMEDALRDVSVRPFVGSPITLTLDTNLTY